VGEPLKRNVMLLSIAIRTYESRNPVAANMKNQSTSTKIYLGLVLFLIGVKSFFLLAPVRFPLSDQAGAFSWLTILTIAALGFVGLVLSKRTGLLFMSRFLT